MPERPISRRDVLATGSALALAAIAGCTTSSAGDGGETPSGDATPTPGAGNSSPSSPDADHHDDNTHHEETSHSDGHDHEHGSLPAEPAGDATVTMKTTDDGYHFDPHVVWVEEGATVTFELVSGTHTATAYATANDLVQRIPESAEAFDSGSMSEAGATFEHTFETAGVYDYNCLPHESVGMIGSVVVGNPDAHGQPGLAEPQDQMPEKARQKVADLNAKVNEMLGHTHDSEESEDETETTEDGHDDGDGDGHHNETTEDGHDDGHDDDGHHEETTEDGHHDGDGDHHEKTTEDGHDQDGHDGDGHHEETTEDSHHDD